MGWEQTYQKTSTRTYTVSRNFSFEKNSKGKKVTDALKNEYIKLLIIDIVTKEEKPYMLNKGLV